MQLSEEGAVQVFRPIANNDLIVGAVGVLQFDVVVARLKSDNVEALYESVNVSTARWVECDDVKKFEEFKRKNEINLGAGRWGQPVLHRADHGEPQPDAGTLS